MGHTVRYGDTLSGIAQQHLGNANKWPEIAHLNHLRNPDFLLIGQELKLPAGALQTPAGGAHSNNPHFLHPATRMHAGAPASSHQPLEHRPARTIPARAFFFVVADEFDFTRRKLVRKVVIPKGAKLSPALAHKIVRPDIHGFSPRDPVSRVSVGRHVLGRTDSKYISASERPLGSPRFQGERYWIDVRKLQAAGSTIHEAPAISADLDRISKKTKDPRFLDYIEDIRKKSLTIDREVLIEGQVPAGAVKGAGAMGLTRGLQVVQGIGIVVSVYDLGKASAQSYEQHSVKPIAAETVRQAGGWAGGLAGAEIGAEIGVALGIETGPGAIITGAIGGLIGGAIGFFDADIAADQIHPN
jgi:hypothetical protein